MTAYTFDESIVSDLHKDARGYRPVSVWWNIWETSSDEDKQSIWDSLLQELEWEINNTREAEAMALIAMHQKVQGVMLLGAKTEVQALKWIIEAEEFDNFDLKYGADYFCYRFGLNYSAKNEFPIQEAINEMLAEVV